ncbi:MAG: hypothetical protein O9284_01550 [Steroidobacteraceae bacterium]|nr:hypothetical protein [Steroidobacteraceae bacterium]
MNARRATEGQMDMTIEPVDTGLVSVALHGRLDGPGVDAIETRLTAALERVRG